MSSSPHSAIFLSFHLVHSTHSLSTLLVPTLDTYTMASYASVTSHRPRSSTTAALHSRVQSTVHSRIQSRAESPASERERDKDYWAGHAFMNRSTTTLHPHRTGESSAGVRNAPLTLDQFIILQELQRVLYMGHEIEDEEDGEVPDGNQVAEFIKARFEDDCRESVSCLVVFKSAVFNIANTRSL